MRKLLIFGATDLAAIAHYVATHECGLNVAGFVVDAGYKTQPTFMGCDVIEWGDASSMFDAKDTDIFVAIGYRNMRRRRAVYQQLAQAGYNLINLISAASYMAKNAAIGKNNLIMPGVVIEPHVVMGDNNVIWSNATMCHDTRIGDHNFIAANATLGGHVQLGDLNFIGFSATVTQHVSIGDETLIGAQSLLREDAEGLRRYWGVPAKDCGVVDSNTGICID